MNKIYVGLIVVVVVLGGLFLVLKSKKLEAPIRVENEETKLDEVNTQKKQEESKDLETKNSAPVKEFVVNGANFSFDPSLITVKKGDKVKIIFKNTEGFHDFKIDEFGVATKQAKAPDQEVLEFIADKAGSFEYYCSVGTHRSMGMKGILKVE